MSIFDGFWAEIDDQLARLRTAKSAAEVFEILGTKLDLQDSRAHAFFAGGGGDVTPDEPLSTAGWRYEWCEASYYWCMRAPNGDFITYVEGDVYAGDQGRPE